MNIMFSELIPVIELLIYMLISASVHHVWILLT